MKVLMLADPAASHTIKWVNSLSEKGIEIYLFGFGSYNPSVLNKNVKVETFNTPDKIKAKTDGAVSKIIYFTALKRINSLIKKIKPDILHSHYASSHGLIGALTNFHPYIISVWGSDIYNFPAKTIFHRKIIEYSLIKADKILSTSKTMLLHTKKYTDKNIEVTPFGVDINKFKPMSVQSVFTPDDFVIGTIKSLEKKYGIEYLIKAFSIVKNKLPSIPLKLLIVGSGKLEWYLKNLVNELNLSNDTIFTGHISPVEVPKFHNMLDIYVSLSIEESESFGVAILEASACEKPVVVSNVGGLPEVVEHNISGLIVESKNITEAATAIEKLVLDGVLRKKLGKAGRERVTNYYNWEDNVAQMINIYRQLR